jgi:hypothetical protein
VLQIALFLLARTFGPPQTMGLSGRPFAARRSHRCAIVRAMSRDGSLVLSDVRAPTLMIVCEPCGRRGQYNVERPMTEHGAAKLADLLTTLADCPRGEGREHLRHGARAVYKGLAAR